MAELLPCPFCGAVPRFDDEQGMPVCVLCGECGASSGFYPAGRYDEAAAAWNTRANMGPLLAEIEALREALAAMVSWFPSADTYRRLGFDPKPPMQVLKEAKALLFKGDTHERS